MVKKLFRQMSTTQILSAATVTLCMLIDSIVIGRLLGVESMSAYGLASPLLIVFSALGTTISCGAQVVCGKYIGAGDTEGSNRCFSASVVLALAMAGAGMLLVLPFWQHICTLLGAGSPAADNRVFYLTGDYLRGWFLGAPAFFLNQIMTPYLQIYGKRGLLTWSVAAMTAANIVLDLLSVCVFHLGMFGIGLASSLSYLAALAVGIWFFLRKDCPFRFRRRGLRLGLVWEILRGGGPVIVNQVCFTLHVYLINLLLLSLSGTEAVAAYAVISSLGNLFFSVGLGTGSVALTLSAIFYSEEDRTSLTELVRVTFLHTLLLIVPAVLVAVLAAPLLTRLFLGNDASVLAVAVPGLQLYSLSLIPCSVITALKNYYQGIRRVGFTHLISILNGLVLVTLCAWGMSLPLGITGVWVGISLGNLATLLLISLVAWRSYGSVSFRAECYSLLPRDFGARPEDCFDAAIPDQAAAVAVSEQLMAFCGDHGLDRRTSMLIGLCVEEITVNILTHGFEKDKRRHNVDVRLVLREDKRLIRIRDNCVHFDPTSYLSLHQSDDPTAHIGLRMVMGMVREANYVNSLGLNNLSLVL